MRYTQLSEKHVSWMLPEACLEHDAGDGHPESAQRLHAIDVALVKAGVPAASVLRENPPVQDKALQRVHGADHLARLDAIAVGADRVALDPDTVADAGSVRAARAGAGAACAAVDCVLMKRHHLVVCGLRPPGHHAEPNRAMGFCLLNSVAIAAADALAVHGLSRVAVLDFDVHYGNGTSMAFLDDPRVLVCQTYQHPFYPHWVSPKRTNIVDCPLPAGSDGTAMRAAVETAWAPALAEHAPELLLVSAGFDAHVADPLAGLRWKDSDFAWLGTWIAEQAVRHCDGRAVAVLEGGYDPAALSASLLDFARGFSHGLGTDQDALRP